MRPTQFQGMIQQDAVLPVPTWPAGAIWGRAQLAGRPDAGILLGCSWSLCAGGLVECLCPPPSCFSTFAPHRLVHLLEGPPDVTGDDVVSSNFQIGGPDVAHQMLGERLRAGGGGGLFRVHQKCVLELCLPSRVSCCWLCCTAGFPAGWGLGGPTHATELFLKSHQLNLWLRSKR